jgi:hypothetical protein
VQRTEEDRISALDMYVAEAKNGARGTRTLSETTDVNYDTDALNSRFSERVQGGYWMRETRRMPTIPQTVSPKARS